MGQDEFDLRTICPLFSSFLLLLLTALHRLITFRNKVLNMLDQNKVVQGLSGQVASTSHPLDTLSNDVSSLSGYTLHYSFLPVERRTSNRRVVLDKEKMTRLVYAFDIDKQIIYTYPCPIQSRGKRR